MRKKELGEQKDLTDTSKASKIENSRKVIRTKTIDDVFTDEIEMVKPRFEVNYDAYLNRLWEANPEIYKCLKEASDLEKARDTLYS